AEAITRISNLDELATILERLGAERSARILSLTDLHLSSDALGSMNANSAAKLLGFLDPPYAAALLDRMFSTRSAKLLNRMSPEQAARILVHMEWGFSRLTDMEPAHTAKTLARMTPSEVDEILGIGPQFTGAPQPDPLATILDYLGPNKVDDI